MTNAHIVADHQDMSRDYAELPWVQLPRHNPSHQDTFQDMSWKPTSRTNGTRPSKPAGPVEASRLVRWWGQMPSEALLCALSPTSWALLAELCRHEALWPARGGMHWSALDGLANPGTINRAGDRLVDFGLIDLERSPGGNRVQVRLKRYGRWIPVPLVNPRNLDGSLHKLLPTLWAISELTLAASHRRRGTDPIDAWTHDGWATAADVADLTGTSIGNARRQLKQLSDDGLAERSCAQAHEIADSYRPMWHLWATHVGQSVKGADLRARKAIGPHKVLELLHESDRIARQIARSSRDPARPSIPSIGHRSHVSNPYPPIRPVDDHVLPRGARTQQLTHSAHRTPPNELRDALATSSGPWAALFKAETNPIPHHLRRLNIAISAALGSGWTTDQLVNVLDACGDLPKQPRHPTALLAFRVGEIAKDVPSTRSIAGFADYEPESYNARVSPPPYQRLNGDHMHRPLLEAPTSAERDSMYRGLLASGDHDAAAEYAARSYGIDRTESRSKSTEAIVIEVDVEDCHCPDVRCADTALTRPNLHAANQKTRYQTTPLPSQPETKSQAPATDTARSRWSTQTFI